MQNREVQGQAIVPRVLELAVWIIVGVAACGVTMGIEVDEDGTTRYVCLECGFSDGCDTVAL